MYCLCHRALAVDRSDLLLCVISVTALRRRVRYPVNEQRV